jgi:phytoene dehydrogenase-like protein
MIDAAVIGAGPNGLVAANVLADAGWSVTVFEANEHAGGAVKTEQLTAPGFANDVFSAFYPLTVASPVIARLELERFGLQWTHAPAVLAHPRRDGPTAVLSRDIDVTAASLALAAPGDDQRYRDVIEGWQQIAPGFMRALLDPFPPVRAAVQLLGAGGIHGSLDLARTALLPLRRFLDERFAGESANLLFAGNALHADLTPDTSGSALFGLMLVGLGQQFGFPVPVGGAGRIADALARRAAAGGVEIRLATRVERVEIDDGRAVGVRLAGGELVRAKTVLADCDAQVLMMEMVGARHLPDRVLQRMTKFQRAAGTVKVDWALASPVPWSDPVVGTAGTVHVADSVDELTLTSAQLAMNQIPADPFLLVGQMTTADPTRSPPGTESMWAYTHVPQDPVADAGGDGLTGRWDAGEAAVFTDRIEARIEALAPGFRSRIIARHVMTPPDLEARDRNLVGGDIGGGTAQLHQQLVFRPITGAARPETSIRDLYLASASAHPGGAVHGACGNNAARAALLHHPMRRVLRRRRS